MKMNSKDAEALLKEVDKNLRAHASEKEDASNLQMARMYGSLREACWMHLTTGEDLKDILKRLWNY
jgi:hypothetical protein